MIQGIISAIIWLLLGTIIGWLSFAYKLLSVSDEKLEQIFDLVKEKREQLRNDIDNLKGT